MQAYILASFAALAAASIIYIVFFGNNKKLKFSGRPLTEIEKFVSPTNFFIHNYFPNHKIAIDVKFQNGDTVNMIDLLEPLKSKGLTREQVKTFLEGGNILKIYLLPAQITTRIHFLDYVITTDKLDRIKSLHIGMITTRFIGSTDVLRMSTTSGNAIGGSAFLRVHNLSYIPLRINEELVVPPHSTEKYKGYLHQGVTLGTILKVDPMPGGEVIYPDFQYLKPYTDIYYGIVSDIRQPINGCWQTEFSDLCDYGQTMWPFEDGII